MGSRDDVWSVLGRGGDDGHIRPRFRTDFQSYVGRFCLVQHPIYVGSNLGTPTKDWPCCRTVSATSPRPVCLQSMVGFGIEHISDSDEHISCNRFVTS